MTGRCPCGNAGAGPFAPGQCRPCWLWLNDPRYRDLWSGRPVAPRTPAAAPCRHRGDALTVRERERLSLDRSKLWVWCEGDEARGAPAGQPVCPCSGCGARCPGYEAVPPAGG